MTWWGFVQAWHLLSKTVEWHKQDNFYEKKKKNLIKICFRGYKYEKNHKNIFLKSILFLWNYYKQIQQHGVKNLKKYIKFCDLF